MGTTGSEVEQLVNIRDQLYSILTVDEMHRSDVLGISSEAIPWVDRGVKLLGTLAGEIAEDIRNEIPDITSREVLAVMLQDGVSIPDEGKKTLWHVFKVRWEETLNLIQQYEDKRLPALSRRKVKPLLKARGLL